MVIINKYKRLIACMLILFMMPSMFCISYAASAASSVSANLNSWIDKMVRLWGGEDNPEFLIHLEYCNGEDDTNTIYKTNYFRVAMPDSSESSGRIVYTYSANGAINFKYQIIDSGGTAKEYPININFYAYDSFLDNAETMLESASASNYSETEDESFEGYMMTALDDYMQYEGREIYISLSTVIEGNETTVKRKICDSFDPTPYGSTANVRFVDRTQANVGLLERIWKWIVGVVDGIANFALDLVGKIVNGLFLTIGDGALTVISEAVGRPVTLDKVIFGKIDKFSINFWDEDGNTTKLKDVVNYWYNVFRDIAIIIYLIALLVVGIKILLASTGETKAKYNTVLVSWLSGMMILFLFPYVMKYMAKLNDTIIQIISLDPEVMLSTEEGAPLPTPTVDSSNIETLSKHFGEDDFVNTISPDFDINSISARRDLMMYIRYLAGDLQELSLTFVYFIMIGQLLVIVWVYYKRVFMISFLIVIFPIVAAMYIIEKLSSGNSNSFTTWFKEYTVLVFTQTFHAATYVIVVNAGVKSYMKNDNWLFMLMSVIFLFQGEKLLRSIFGVKSSANTIGDLAKAGLAGYGIAKTVGGLFAKDKGGNSEEQQEKEATKKVEQSKQAQRNISEASSGDEHAETGEHTDGGVAHPHDSDGGAPQVNTNPRKAMENFENAQNVVKAKALHKRNKSGKNILQKATSIGVKGIAATGAMAFTAAKGGDLRDAINSGIAAKEVGKLVAAPAKHIIKGISGLYNGKKFKRDMKNGKYDKELKEVGFDIESFDDTQIQELFRDALANAGSAFARGNDGEYAAIKTVDNGRKKAEKR